MANRKTQADEKAVWVGPTQVVDASMLGAMTEQGWVLLERFENTESIQVSKSHANPSYGRNDGHDNYTQTFTSFDTEAGVVSMFLIGKTEETALAEALENETRARAEAKFAEESKGEIERALAEMTRKADAAQATAESRMVQLGQSAEKCTTQRELRQKLEVDMAKVVARIGQREWDAAVGDSS